MVCIVQIYLSVGDANCEHTKLWCTLTVYSNFIESSLVKLRVFPALSSLLKEQQLYKVLKLASPGVVCKENSIAQTTVFW